MDACAAAYGEKGGRLMLDKKLFYVVVPFYNEEMWIERTLESLAEQTDREFTLVLVDNNSSDDSVGVVARWSAKRPDMAVEVIEEPEKGTGAAADTGFRYAIDRGAKVVARTDADCLPAADWVERLKGCFEVDKLDFVAGAVHPRRDEAKLSWVDLAVIAFLLRFMETAARIIRRGKQYKYHYILVAGNNLAIRAEIYLQSGGFPRTRIEDVHEDKIICERVRMITGRVRKRKDVIVYNSVRRARKYGYLNTLLWYWDHRYKPAEVDIR
jgi:glycosyltransferase involved in cell wall biosynthesis